VNPCEFIKLRKTGQEFGNSVDINDMIMEPAGTAEESAVVTWQGNPSAVQKHAGDITCFKYPCNPAVKGEHSPIGHKAGTARISLANGNLDVSVADCRAYKLRDSGILSKDDKIMSDCGIQTDIKWVNGSSFPF